MLVQILSTYGPHYLNDIRTGCGPIAIILAEWLVEDDTGLTEGHTIANIITNNIGIKGFMIEDEAWGWFWEELIVNKKGLQTLVDHEGVQEHDYNYVHIARPIDYEVQQWFLIQ